MEKDVKPPIIQRRLQVAVIDIDIAATKFRIRYIIALWYIIIVTVDDVICVI